MGNFFYTDRFEPPPVSHDQQLIEMAYYFESNPYLNYIFDRIALCFVNKWQVLVSHYFYSPEGEEALREFNTFLLENDLLEKNDIHQDDYHLIFQLHISSEKHIEEKIYPSELSPLWNLFVYLHISPNLARERCI
ncbi:MAG: hypothetical protein ABI045_02560 [Flavobacteriales bacterium]